jgi:hypothetical protein
MYLLQQLATLISKDAPHEYAGSPTLVELTVDEDGHFCSVGDASSLHLVGGELPRHKPLKDREMLVRIFKV